VSEPGISATAAKFQIQATLFGSGESNIKQALHLYFGEGPQVDSVYQAQPSLSPKGRVRYSLYRFLHLSLALMVFLWGTGYKLSLYRPPDNRVPAKLCTRASDAAKSAVDHAADGSKMQPETLLLTRVSMPETVPQGLLRRDGHDDLAQNLSPLRSTPNLHLRPPPAELRVQE
jgi:hypothetical protein